MESECGSHHRRFESSRFRFPERENLLPKRCILQRFIPNGIIWKVGREAECASFENWCAARYRGFESLTFRSLRKVSVAKKGRNKKFAAAKEKILERGFIVVSVKTGRRVYLGHPEGVDEVEANRLSDGLAAETRVVPFDAS